MCCLNDSNANADAGCAIIDVDELRGMTRGNKGRKNWISKSLGSSKDYKYFIGSRQCSKQMIPKIIPFIPESALSKLTRLKNSIANTGLEAWPIH